MIYWVWGNENEEMGYAKREMNRINMGLKEWGNGDMRIRMEE